LEIRLIAACSSISPPRQAEPKRAHIESFGGQYREECRNQHWFTTIFEARETGEEWRHDHNTECPRGSLKYHTPEKCAAMRSFGKNAMGAAA